MYAAAEDVDALEVPEDEKEITQEDAWVVIRWGA